MINFSFFPNNCRLAFMAAMVGFLLQIQPLAGHAQQSPRSKVLGWKQSVENLLPLLGHRNWVLVVDKAFPLQTGDGMEVIYTNADYFEVLKWVKNKIDAADHIKANILLDKELGYITPQQIPTIDTFKSTLFGVIGKDYQTIPHETIFERMTTATKNFKVLVLKTRYTLPYTSVFIELGCKYWDADKEKELRKRMD